MEYAVSSNLSITFTTIRLLVDFRGDLVRFVDSEENDGAVLQPGHMLLEAAYVCNKLNVFAYEVLSVIEASEAEAHLEISDKRKASPYEMLIASQYFYKANKPLLSGALEEGFGLVANIHGNAEFDTIEKEFLQVKPNEKVLLIHHNSDLSVLQKQVLIEREELALLEGALLLQITKEGGKKEAQLKLILSVNHYDGSYVYRDVKIQENLPNDLFGFISGLLW